MGSGPRAQIPISQVRDMPGIHWLVEEIEVFPRGWDPGESSQVPARIAILVTAPLALWLADNILPQNALILVSPSTVR